MPIARCTLPVAHCPLPIAWPGGMPGAIESRTHNDGLHKMQSLRPNRMETLARRPTCSQDDERFPTGGWSNDFVHRQWPLFTVLRRMEDDMFLEEALGRPARLNPTILF